MVIVVVIVVPKRGGGAPTIAPYSSVVVLLPVVVVLVPHHLKETPPSVAITVIIGLIHWEPLLVQFLDLVAIGWAEGALAIHPPPPPAPLLLLLLVPTFLPIFIQGMATRLPMTYGSIARQPGTVARRQHGRRQQGLRQRGQQ
jgi:hypothetical protein